MDGVLLSYSDEFFGHILFDLRFGLAYSFRFLLKMLFDESIFLFVFTFSSVTPVCETGSQSIVLKYRTISAQSYISEMFESLFSNSIWLFVNSIFIEELHSFHPGWLL